MLMTTPNLPSGMHVLERGWLSSNNILFRDGLHKSAFRFLASMESMTYERFSSKKRGYAEVP